MKDGYPMDGPPCAACNATEADCARMRQCCTMCSHFTHLDERGNTASTGGRPPTRRPLRAVR